MSDSFRHSQSMAADGALYDLIEELTERLNRQEPVDLAAVIAAHPEHAEQLRQVWPSLAILANLRSVDARSALSFPPLTMTDEGTLTGVLGDFRLLREIGRGGMGIVYKAEQISLGRTVALKVLPFAGVLDDRQLQRFRNEARAAAGLKHPHIVPVYAVGCERGVHYYAMEYIEGRTLANVIAELRGEMGRSAPGVSGTTQSVEPDPEARLSEKPGLVRAETAALQAGSTAPGRGAAVTFRTIAEWIAQAAEALDYAHSVGIVHRDIKPSNLLLDARGQVWITDFGLARLETDAALTVTGDVLGTLRYMSPEQALGERGVIDHRADIYSLGATLYELLTRAPLCSSANRAELLRHIERDDPPAPRRLDPTIPADLETIVLKAIAKDPATRYAAAKDFADDLRRFLDDQPIRARRPTAIERLHKWSRRHRTLVRSLSVAAAVSLVSLAAANVLIFRERSEAIRQRNIAQQNEAIAQQKEKEARESEQKVREREAVIRGYLYAADIHLAAQAYHKGDIPQALEKLMRHRPARDTPDERGFEWHYLWGLCQDESRVWHGHSRDVFRVAYSPDGRLLASASRDRSVIVWNVADGMPRAGLQDFTDDVNAVAFSADGRLLATAEENQRARVWEWETGREIAQFTGFAQPVADVFFTPDQQHLVATEIDWHTHQGGRITVWNLATGELHAAVDGYRALAMHAETQRLAGCTGNDGLALWSLPDLKLQSSWVGHTSPIRCGVFSRDGRFLATGGGTGYKIKLWRLDDRAEARFPTEDSEYLPPARILAFTPDGRTLVSTHDDGTARVWDVPSRTTLKVLPEEHGRSWSTAVAPDGKAFAIGCEDGSVVLRTFAAMAPERQILEASQQIDAAAADATASRLALIFANGSSAAILDAHSGAELLTIPHPDGRLLSSVAFAPDGRSIWLGDVQGAIQQIDLTTNEYRNTHQHHAGVVESLFVSPDGGSIATASRDDTFQVWDWKPARIRLALNRRNQHGILVRSLVGFLDDASLLTTELSSVDVWDLPTGEMRRRFDDKSPWVGAVAVTRDGSILASATEDRSIRLWNVATGQLKTTLMGRGDRLAFSADGRTLASMSVTGELKLWHVPTGQHLFDLVGSEGGHQLLQFSADGRRLLCVASGRDIFVWGAP